MKIIRDRICFREFNIFKILKLPIYIILPSIHATIAYFMVKFGCTGENYGYFLLILILVANCSFSLGT